MATHERKTIAVLGAGSWGTALAVLLADNGVSTRLWGHKPAHIERLKSDRENQQFLPGVKLPDGLMPMAELSQALHQVDDVLLVVPSHAFRQVLRQVVPLLEPATRLCWATKGLEMDRIKFLHQVVEEEQQNSHPYAVISGPTFAAEVAKGLPSAATVASKDCDYAEHVAQLLHSDHFRAYTSDDVIGVQLGGAAKNVMAIAAGVSDGLGFGANARAALITRGLAEIFRLGVAMGGHQETFMGLAGMGDLVLTCTDNQSRNRRFGLALAGGDSAEKAMESIGQVVEGADAAKVIFDLSQQKGIEMPITEQVYQVLYKDLDPHEAVHALFARHRRPEFS